MSDHDFQPTGHGPDMAGPIQHSGVWDVLQRWRRERRRFVLVTVVASRGFTPRKAGAHMLVDDAGHTAGSVGGGAIEHEAIAQAKQLMDERSDSTLMHHHLTRELGMCCGGEMTLFLELLEPAPRLFLFGAGYIAKPLAGMAAGCGFDVTVVDSREDWASQTRFPTSHVVQQAPDDYARSLETTEHDYVVIVTHDHALDHRLAQTLLGRPLRFLGNVGSVPKQRKFALRLKSHGFTDEQIGTLRMPLGLAIGAASPEEIAVSIMAELVAVRRGGSVQPGWTPPPSARRSGTASQLPAELAETTHEEETS